MKILEIGIDANGRSAPGLIDVPLKKVSDTEAISAKQPATIWRIGTRPTTNIPRTNKDYDAAGGAFEQHLGGEPHLIAWQTGYLENTLQDGFTWRFAPGDLMFVRPGALHHSNIMSPVPATVFNLYLPGSATDTGPLDIKK
jgi:hypothetical protein